MARPDPTILVRIDLRHHYGVLAMLGITRGARAQNWRLIVEQIDAADSKRNSWNGKNIRGVIVQSTGPADALLADLGKPVVNVAGMHCNILPTVTVNDLAVGRMAAEHLMTLPLAHFAYLAHPDRVYSADRQRGFVAALRHAGHTCHTLNTWSLVQSVQWLRQLPKPVGLMLPNDLGAAQLLQACATTNYDVRQQVAMIGVDNEPHICEYVQPTLTSIDPNTEEIGYEATVMLAAMLRNQKTPRLRLLPPGRIVIRDSTRLAAINPHIAHALTLIRRHAASFQTIDDLLQHIPMSRRTLERHFRQTIGRSPLEEINRVRLAEARRLLAATDLSVDQIARRTGFTSASWLGKSMRAAGEPAPSAFRRQARRQNALPNS